MQSHTRTHYDTHYLSHGYATPQWLKWNFLGANWGQVHTLSFPHTLSPSQTLTQSHTFHFLVYTHVRTHAHTHTGLVSHCQCYLALMCLIWLASCLVVVLCAVDLSIFRLAGIMCLKSHLLCVCVLLVGRVFCVCTLPMCNKWAKAIALFPLLSLMSCDLRVGCGRHT